MYGADARIEVGVVGPHPAGHPSDLRIATGMSGSPLAARLLHHVLADAGFRRHMDQTRARLQEKMIRTIKHLKGIGVMPWLEPAGGLFLWCKLPDAIDAADVARRALADDVLFAPGNVFSVSQSAGSFMRFNVAMMEDAKILRVLEKAMTQSARAGTGKSRPVISSAD